MPQATLERQISSGWSVEQVKIWMHYDGVPRKGDHLADHWFIVFPNWDN
jgi:hypothetical protein